MEDFLVESDGASEVDDQTKAWETEPLSLALKDANFNAECGIGHRVVASRSVLALALDDECVYAGLQGGDILVSAGQFCWHIFQAARLWLTVRRHGPSRRMISSSQFMPTRRVSWVSISLKMALCSFLVVVIQ